LPLGEEDKPGVVNVKYIAELCSKDRGLYKDVVTNIDKCLNWMNHYNLTLEEAERIRERLNQIKQTVQKTPKTLKWKLRAKIGERKAWSRTIEGQRIATSDIEKEIEKRRN